MHTNDIVIFIDFEFEFIVFFLRHLIQFTSTENLQTFEQNIESRQKFRKKREVP